MAAGARGGLQMQVRDADADDSQGRLGEGRETTKGKE
jgi:hypothetical protein